MHITIKSPEDQQKMRVAGRLAADVLDMITDHVVPGVTTEELDRLCHDFIINTQHAVPANLGYRGFPKTVCTSVNHVVCHGIPNDKKLKGGDIVNIDVTVIYEGYHGDTSRMYFVGKPPVQAERLSKICFEAMWAGIRTVRPGVRLGDIGHAIQSLVEANDFSVVREYCGHGIGKIYHEDPQVLHYGEPGTGVTLQAGMTFTIEPMINAGKRHVRQLPDGWTVVTKDHSLSAQWEHTVLVTGDGYEVLTLGSQGPEIRGPDLTIMVSIKQAALDEEETRDPPSPLDWPLLERLPAVLAEKNFSPDAFRQVVRDSQEELKNFFFAEESVEALVRARAQFIDSLLRLAWERQLDAGLAQQIALLAVGGYGRGELHPFSDVDILVLVPADPPLPESSRSQIEALVAFLWDIGLEVGHSVRSARECAEESAADVGVMTTLLEARLLVGSAQLRDDMRPGAGARSGLAGTRILRSQGPRTGRAPRQGQ